MLLNRGAVTVRRHGLVYFYVNRENAAVGSVVSVLMGYWGQLSLLVLEIVESLETSPCSSVFERMSCVRFVSSTWIDAGTTTSNYVHDACCATERSALNPALVKAAVA